MVAPALERGISTAPPPDTQSSQAPSLSLEPRQVNHWLSKHTKAVDSGEKPEELAKVVYVATVLHAAEYIRSENIDPTTAPLAEFPTVNPTSEHIQTDGLIDNELLFVYSTALAEDVLRDNPRSLEAADIASNGPFEPVQTHIVFTSQLLEQDRRQQPRG